MFVKIRHNVTGHDIIMHVDTLMSRNKLKWINNDVDEEDFDGSDCIAYTKFGTGYTEESYKKMMDAINHDFRGYEHTYNNVDITNNKRDMKQYPAFQYCIQNSMGDYKGYLPAAGELSFISDNNDIIQNILSAVNKRSVRLDIQSGRVWTSTESDYQYARLLHNGLNKTAEEYVMPLFKFNGSNIK